MRVRSTEVRGPFYTDGLNSHGPERTKVHILGMVLDYDTNNDNDFRLASKMAVLADGMEETSTVVAICLGSTPDREKRNPEEAAENICRIADQIVEEVPLCQSIVNKYLHLCRG